MLMTLSLKEGSWEDSPVSVGENYVVFHSDTLKRKDIRNRSFGNRSATPAPCSLIMKSRNKGWLSSLVPGNLSLKKYTGS